MVPFAPIATAGGGSINDCSIIVRGAGVGCASPPIPVACSVGVSIESGAGAADAADAADAVDVADAAVRGASTVWRAGMKGPAALCAIG